MEEIVDVNTLFGPLPVASTDLAVDALLALMQKHQVKAACTLSTLGLLLDPAIGNAATRAACVEHAELLPVATLNPTMYFGDAAALLRLPTEGFRLLRFFPAQQGWPIAFAPFRSLLRSLDETRLPLMIDTDAPGALTALFDPLDTYPAPVILSRVNVDTLAEAVAALRHHDNWYVEISRLLAPGAIQLLAETVGASRLLFGTGAPIRPIASTLQTLQHAGLSDADRRQILSANVRRILNLDT
jgi:predicted TIM-barrel fold metal-dependent hydrolase